MDNFFYLADYRTWICIPCGMGVKPNHYLAHLTRHHADHPTLGPSKKERLQLVKELLLKCPASPESPEFQLPSAGQFALPHLPISEGFMCPQCNFTCSTKSTMIMHCQKQHIEHKRARGRPSKAIAVTAPQWKQVSCQRLFIGGCKSQYFAVVSPAEVEAEKETLRRQELATELPDVMGQGPQV